MLTSTTDTQWRQRLKFDHDHIWHPYTAIGHGPPIFPVVAADGVRLELADGRTLIDGMASWWSVIHGYNHPALTEAMKAQIDRFPHVMFGGLTHEPAIELAKTLTEMLPADLNRVFFADSGSVSVEVAVKMAVQYWLGRDQPQRQKLVTVRRGYHGDTFGAMAVCDPETGMHGWFNQNLTQHHFLPAPPLPFHADPTPRQLEAALQPLRDCLAQHGKSIAALILEPIVQGAGGMRFYHPALLRGMHGVCREHGILIIHDEIATGFGRTGKLFAMEHADVVPDIICLGKALTGGTMTLAATITSPEVADTISRKGPLMHGPTFMANPLACSSALASLRLLQTGAWQDQVHGIETRLNRGLAPCRDLPNVAEVRVLGAIGVVELKAPVNMHQIQPRFVEAGVWVRPFGKLVYVMPPYVMGADDLDHLTAAIHQVLADA
ncbi:adenosylmethionine--8-amino-7-oxononanoate transaminase [Acanthopleuribacter pedis]|uniref:Adenosylmethionine-8-amino-7-oxononanoate aminotransferase n=1 Tax=Acanthopleuribacter pedis TaxID=442870 RepID=A0A8J7U3A1_9BACT|nr:adenosylmethionine--8-amino-7-oxononanoate transaminase [Acanthopleuribacter pedis]MBO1320178.1 adenosylmethionine--8-amino-7-oxononanoate transaminase [Acanthopleuribacter pedis]